MYEVDRLVVVIKPTEPLLLWLQERSRVQKDLTIDQLQKDCTVLLVPPFRSPQKAEEYIDTIYQGIFENELESWGIPEENWPENRDLKTFHHWFNVEFHSMVFDIANVGRKQNEVLDEIE